jgi:predicted glycosyltransferase
VNSFYLLFTHDCVTEFDLGFAGLKVWIDVLTPKHALFFEPLYRDLVRDGHELLLTTRTYREAVEALRLKQLRFRIVGEHGGGSRYGKLLASGVRVVKLARLIESWRPDTAVSFSSPEAARVAFGLGVPHVAVNDSPHSWLVARLSIPLSRYVCSPWIIRRKVWLSFGAWPDGIVTYKALDAAAWLKRYNPNPAVLKQLSLKRDKPIIVLRTEESFASYLEGKASDSAPVIGPVTEEILRRKLDAQVVISTRYGRQAPVLRQKFGDRVHVVDHIVDATSLLYYSTIFIGSGGTMTVEAALLGRPAISNFPGEKPLYIKYLERKGLVKTIQSPREIALRVARTLASEQEREEQEKRGTKLLRQMEDPIKVISRVVRKTWRKNEK